MRDFFKAAIPEPVTLLGQKLEPFSVGHWILCERFDCSYITGGQATIPDLMMGVLICCHKYDEFLHIAREGCIYELSKKWTKQIGNFSFPEKSKAFSDYVDDSIKNCPKYWVEDKGTSSGKPSGAPYIQTIKSFLISKTNLTEQEVLNRPFAQAVWDMTTCLEIDGTLKINSKEDDEAAEEAKRFETYFEGLTEEEKNKMRGIPANN